MLSELFARYEQLGLAADLAFERIQRDYAEAVKCKRGCTDCCHALFGLFPIEAAYLREHFAKLDPAVRQEVLKRAQQAEERLNRFQTLMSEAHGDDPAMQSYALSRERIRCPLLNDQGDCVLYQHRPVTCRVYGIPTRVNGAGRTCWKAAFETGKSYPAFNLDRVHKELYEMSKAALEKEGQSDPEGAALLVSVSAALKQQPED